jgi:hypothetical protein
MVERGASATTGLTPLRGGIVVLALATAIIHIDPTVVTGQRKRC